ncbi:MAG TPA: MBL fold metallo-hydrolase [Spirochaetota bacterium]|nr:MBL fold metallo-hydrolase [Spirochaetota bacterium]
MRIPGTNIVVDDFYTSDADYYALTHYHSDHRKGLRQGDTRSIICSTITLKLLISLNDVPVGNITAIDPGDQKKVSDDVTIKAYDANHCPGAVMFLFIVNGRKYLHTGDFRYCDRHDKHQELFDDIDTLYVDSTFKSEEGNYYNHPSQEEAIEQIIKLITSNKDKTIYLGLYQIGKNRIINAIHERLGIKVYVNEERRNIYSIIGMDEAVTTNPKESNIKGYAINYFYNHFKKQHPNYQADSIVIIPTGWSHDRNNCNGFYYIPYSEHNSSDELKRFIEKVKPLNIIETNV